MWFDKIDFLCRSQLLLNNPAKAIEENHDVTIAINACVGLLFVLNQFVVDNDKRCARLMNETCALENITYKSTYPRDIERLTSGSLLRHIRNSIAHTRFEVIGEQSSIESIRFTDTWKGYEFSIELSVEDFKKIINYYAISAMTVLSR